MTSDGDTSRFYAEISAEYGWKPREIRDELTEAQLHGYYQQLGPMRRDRNRNQAVAIVNEIGRALNPKGK